MAKLKLLKPPPKPNLPKKPKPSAALSTKQSWLRKVNDLKTKYEAKLKAIEAENKKRKAINEASQRASTVIAGIGDILEVRPSAFSAKIVRAKRTGTKTKTKSKTTAKRKAAPKRKTTSRKTTTKRRR